VSPREALQARLATWLSERAQTFSAPYGVLTGLQTRGSARVRTVTFGVARWLDAELTIWSPRRLELRTSREDATFASEAEFYAYAIERWGAPETAPPCAETD